MATEKQPHHAVRRENDFVCVFSRQFLLLVRAEGLLPPDIGVLASDAEANLVAERLGRSRAPRAALLLESC